MIIKNKNLKRNINEGGYMALMATIIISLIMLVVMIEESSFGWNVRFNILGTEAKEQSHTLAEGCIEQTIALLITEPSYSGNATTTTDFGTCHIFPIQFNFPSPGISTIKAQGVVRNSYTNLEVQVDSNFDAVSLREVATGL